MPGELSFYKENAFRVRRRKLDLLQSICSGIGLWQDCSKKDNQNKTQSWQVPQGHWEFWLLLENPREQAGHFRPQSCHGQTVAISHRFKIGYAGHTRFSLIAKSVVPNLIIGLKWQFFLLMWLQKTALAWRWCRNPITHLQSQSHRSFPFKLGFIRDNINKNFVDIQYASLIPDCVPLNPKKNLLQHFGGWAAGPIHPCSSGMYKQFFNLVSVLAFFAYLG